MPRRALVLAAALAALVLMTPAPATAAPGNWIVVLEDSVSDPAAVARDHAAHHRIGARQVFRSVDGYAAAMSDAAVAALRRDPRVAYVEPDGIVHAVAQTMPWGIVRVGAGPSSAQAGNGTGTVAGVNAYVIDTGIDRTQPDLNVVSHVNFAGGANADCNGHGTHVAGTLAARDDAAGVVGVAPGVRLTGVKVLSCSGAGSTSGVIAGIDWVTENAVRPAVANLSLGGFASRALDDAVRRSVAEGVVYSIAAGNEGANACGSSPARAGAGTANGIVTTAATDASDRETSWSNYGNCIDLWAPGAAILSARLGGGTTTLSGTSMAAPHVAGGAALRLSGNLAETPAEVEEALRDAATVTGTTGKGGRPIARLNVDSF